MTELTPKQIPMEIKVSHYFEYMIKFKKIALALIIFSLSCIFFSDYLNSQITKVNTYTLSSAVCLFLAIIVTITAIKTVKSFRQSYLLVESNKEIKTSNGKFRTSFSLNSFIKVRETNNMYCLFINRMRAVLIRKDTMDKYPQEYKIFKEFIANIK